MKREERSRREREIRDTEKLSWKRRRRRRESRHFLHPAIIREWSSEEGRERWKEKENCLNLPPPTSKAAKNFCVRRREKRRRRERGPPSLPPSLSSGLQGAAQVVYRFSLFVLLLLGRLVLAVYPGKRQLWEVEEEEEKTEIDPFSKFKKFFSSAFKAAGRYETEWVYGSTRRRSPFISSHSRQQQRLD